MSSKYRNGADLVRPYETDAAELRAAGLDDRNPWIVERHPEHHAYIQSIIDRLDRENVRPPKYTYETRLEVYRLRDKGYTLRQIADEVGVSKSTACLYIQKKKKLEEIRTAQVTQPGTTKVVETQYLVSEVNIGKIAPKTSTNGVSNDCGK
jgi:Helix-turn-helix domain of resolvase